MPTIAELLGKEPWSSTKLTNTNLQLAEALTSTNVKSDFAKLLETLPARTIIALYEANSWEEYQEAHPEATPTDRRAFLVLSRRKANRVGHHRYMIRAESDDAFK